MSLPRLLATALPTGVVVFLIFLFWVRLPVVIAAGAGALWAIGTLLLGRLFSDDAEREHEEWLEAAPHLRDAER